MSFWTSVFIALMSAYAVDAKVFQFLNKLNEEIWVGCKGEDGYSALHDGGWKLAPHGKTTVYSEDEWSGHFWARTGCDSLTNHCETGDCGNKLHCNGTKGISPITQADFMLQANGNLDLYEINTVHGFNIKMSIEPLGGYIDESQNSCKPTRCHFNILTDCPEELQLKNDDNIVIACKSPCKVFKTDQYCCKNKYNSNETCLPSNWSVNYAKLVKDRCPEAKTYLYDVSKKRFTCDAPVYLITFNS